MLLYPYIKENLKTKRGSIIITKSLLVIVRRKSFPPTLFEPFINSIYEGIEVSDPSRATECGH